MKRNEPRSHAWTPGAMKASRWKSRYGRRKLLMNLLRNDVGGDVGFVDVDHRSFAGHKCDGLGGGR